MGERRTVMNATKKPTMWAALLGVFIVYTLTGCNQISSSVKEDADPSLTFAEIRDNPDQHLGKEVLLGGTIVKTEDRQDKTVVEVQQKRLGLFMEPRDGLRKEAKTKGRFLVVFPGSLDSTLYQEGKRITVTGQVEGKEMGKLEQGDYLYPVIRARDSHVWTSCGEGYYPHSFYSDYYGGYKSPFHRAHHYGHRCYR
jgi:outer membrane lipoprotein